MNKTILILSLISFTFSGIASGENEVIPLPEPIKDGGVSLEKAISIRRSTRAFKDEPLTIEEVGQLLWAAQGITGEGGFKRAAPSAGALYPMEVYVVAGEVEDLPAGLYHYNVQEHALEQMREGDPRTEFEKVTVNQGMVTDAPITIILTAVYERTTVKYGDRGIKYVWIEAGHIGQNICLQAEALGLGTTTIGAFRDDKIKELLEREKEEPLYVLPVGVKP
ncbi:SagB/ThcOx family dehydrogenase [bacterium]|nr:SagB/ThcOx family dehydrogenase [bacterium]